MESIKPAKNPSNKHWQTHRVLPTPVPYGTPLRPMSFRASVKSAGHCSTRFSSRGRQGDAAEEPCHRSRIANPKRSRFSREVRDSCKYQTNKMLRRYHAAGEIATAVHGGGSRKPPCNLYTAWDLPTPLSRLAQARGLKRLISTLKIRPSRSRLAQARGLKQL